MELVKSSVNASSDEWFEGKFPAVFSLGELIQLMIDGGAQKYVIAKCMGASDLCQNGHYRVKLEIELVPECMIVSRAQELGVDAFSDDAFTLLKTHTRHDGEVHRALEDYEKWVKTA
jgi:hypothetical protein